MKQIVLFLFALGFSSLAPCQDVIKVPAPQTETLVITRPVQLRLTPKQTQVLVELLAKGGIVLPTGITSININVNGDGGTDVSIRFNQ